MSDEILGKMILACVLAEALIRFFDKLLAYGAG
jgi:hypothetical protein